MTKKAEIKKKVKKKTATKPKPRSKAEEPATADVRATNSLIAADVRIARLEEERIAANVRIAELEEELATADVRKVALEEKLASLDVGSDDDPDKNGQHAAANTTVRTAVGIIASAIVILLVGIYGLAALLQ